MMKRTEFDFLIEKWLRSNYLRPTQWLTFTPKAVLGRIFCHPNRMETLFRRQEKLAFCYLRQTFQHWETSISMRQQLSRHHSYKPLRAGITHVVLRRSVPIGFINSRLTLTSRLPYQSDDNFCLSGCLLLLTKAWKVYFWINSSWKIAAIEGHKR